MATNFADRFTAEYAVKKASCKHCYTDIGKDDLRIRFLSKALYTSNHFYHPACMFDSFTNRTKVKIMSTADITGMNTLKYADKNLINKCINNYVNKCNAAKLHPNESKVASVKKTKQSATTSKAGTSKTKKATKRGKQDDDEEEEDDDEDEPAKKKTKKTTKKTSVPKKTATAKKTGKPAAQKKTTKAAPAPAPAVVAPAPVVVTPPAPAPAPAAKVTDKKTLSDEAKKSFRSLTGKKLTVADFSVFSVNDLKLVLKLNDRSTTGNKTELSKQLVDYMTNGCPPRCPKCGGGRLRFKKSGKKEEYYCPGYMEDDDFINCSFKSDSVARIPWKNP